MMGAMMLLRRMMPLIVMLWAAGLAAGGEPETARRDGPEYDAAVILGDLGRLRESQRRAEAEKREAIMRELQVAVSDDAAAIKLFSAAIQEMEFAGTERERSKFQEWKGREGANLKSRFFRGALRMQLEYLAVTLRVAWGTDSREMLPFLARHLDAAIRFEDETARDIERIDRRLKMSLMSGQLEELRDERAGVQSAIRLLGQPMASVFYVEWRRLVETVAKAHDWPMTPSDIDGIFRVGLLPRMREAKDPELATVWDRRIAYLAAAAAKEGKEFDRVVFERTRLPTLLWQKAEDLLAIGQPNNAVRLMHSVLMKHQDASDAEKWIGTLEGIVRGRVGR